MTETLVSPSTSPVYQPRLSPSRAYARLMAYAALLDPDRASKAREAARVLIASAGGR